MQRILLSVPVLLLLLAPAANAQTVSVPNTLTNGSVAEADAEGGASRPRAHEAGEPVRTGDGGFFGIWACVRGQGGGPADQGRSVSLSPG